MEPHKIMLFHIVNSKGVSFMSVIIYFIIFSDEASQDHSYSHGKGIINVNDDLFYKFAARLSRARSCYLSDLLSY